LSKGILLTIRLFCNPDLMKRAVPYLAAAVGIAAMLWAAGGNTVTSTSDDFPCFYRAAQLVGTPALYRPGQYDFPGFEIPYMRLPVYAKILQPLTRLGYKRARNLWTGVMVAFMASAFWLWPLKRSDAIAPIAMLACAASPVLSSLGVGQDVAIVMLLVAVSARLLLTGRPSAAGLAASIIFAVKLTYLPAIALVFLVRSRRALAALVAGCLLQFGVSCRIQGGLAWLQDYARVIRDFADPVGLHMPTVYRVLGGGLPFFVAACAIYGCLLLMARGVPVEVALTAALPVAIVAAPHGYIYDFATAVPLFACVLSLDTWAGRAAILALTPLPYALLTNEKFERPVAAVLVLAVALACRQIWRTNRIFQPRRDAKKLCNSAVASAPSTPSTIPMR
jgi:hypothetical protein